MIIATAIADNPLQKRPTSPINTVLLALFKEVL
jgi:hypothetical protein